MATEAELRELLPKHKQDLENAKKLINYGFPTVKPVLPDLLEWVGGDNDPVTIYVILPFLESIGMPLLPYLKTALQADNEWLNGCLINTLIIHNPQLKQSLKSEIEEFYKKYPDWIL